MIRLTKYTPSFIRRYSVKIFDRSVKINQRDWACSDIESSKQVDYLKDEVASRMVDRLLVNAPMTYDQFTLKDIKRRFNRILEMGAGTGHISKIIDDELCKELVVVEASNMFSRDSKEPEYQNENGVKIIKVPGDEETVEFDEGQFDACITSMSAHWVNDLPGMFNRVQKALKPDGAFIGALLGGDTLYELRSSFQLAEMERQGGISPHVSPMTQPTDVATLLNNANFNLITVDIDEFVIRYPSPFELMLDLQRMGESNAIISRKSLLSKETLMAMAAIYKEMYGEDEHIPATFQVIYFIGWKPDPSQPVPLKRGSAKHSFKDLDSALPSDNKE